MNPINKLYDMIKRHEGTGPRTKSGRFLPYKDSVGKWTIGWGRNISDRGISEREAEEFLDEDIVLTRVYLKNKYDWFSEGHIGLIRACAITDMVFNLGATRFYKFVKLRAALERKDWKDAKNEMLDSDWAEQVNDRALELAEMILTGEYQ